MLIHFRWIVQITSKTKSAFRGKVVAMANDHVIGYEKIYPFEWFDDPESHKIGDLFMFVQMEAPEIRTDGSPCRNTYIEISPINVKRTLVSTH